MGKYFLILALFAAFITGCSEQKQQKPEVIKEEEKKAALPDTVIDSDITFDEALSGDDIPASVIKDLVLLDVVYHGFDNKIHKGQIVVSKKVQKDVTAIFRDLFEIKFPVEKVRPVSFYGWDDDRSMRDNNTSGFNYRNVAGTSEKSRHAYGLAIDINPLLNPYINKSIVQPSGAVYDTTKAGTIKKNSDVVKIFKKYGWIWGGDWIPYQDYQHFTKY